jgi:hypothetical protein
MQRAPELMGSSKLLMTLLDIQALRFLILLVKRPSCSPAIQRLVGRKDRRTAFEMAEDSPLSYIRKKAIWIGYFSTW